LRLILDDISSYFNFGKRHGAIPLHRTAGLILVNFSSNGLISQLSDKDRDRLQQICRPAALSEGQSLCLSVSPDADQVYFLTEACITLWVQPENKTRLAIGLVGAEGAVGLGRALGQNVSHISYQVQRSGHAWQASSASLQQLLKSHPAMLWVIARYLWRLTHEIAIMTASVQYDDVQTRMALWLVLYAQRSGSLQLNLTHDELARMLGVRRVSVTLAAVTLKDMGLLNYKRGSVNILDLEALRLQARAPSLKSA
jgi:CRP-like cAMP-binding protein